MDLAEKLNNYNTNSTETGDHGNLLIFPEKVQYKIFSLDFPRRLLFPDFP